MDVMSVLDSLIAMVVVILLLSLVVQAIQEGLKKLFKIKSRQLEDSLVDLLELAMGKAGEHGSKQRFVGSPFARLLWRQAPDAHSAPEVKAVFEAVKARLAAAGRLAQSGSAALDSLKKQDLIGILQSLPLGVSSRAKDGAAEAEEVLVARSQRIQVGIEHWYDTVMQGFEERYSRGMRTWAWVIGLVVVIALDANFFVVAKRIATDGVMRQAIIVSMPKLETLLAASEQPVAPDASADAPTADAQPASKEVSQEDLDRALNSLQDKLDERLGVYTAFGLRTMTWARVEEWWSTKVFFNPISRSWLIYRLADLRYLVGWLIMTMLLSVGAPFWKDALESLFGVKNLLRGKAASAAADTGGGSG